MDTKWKNRAGVFFLFAGLTALVLGLSIAGRQLSRSGSMFGRVQWHAETDYQKTEDFADYISQTLDNFLTIGNETYDYYVYSDGAGRFSEKARTPMAAEYLAGIKGDRNVLYEIKKDGAVLYTNMDAPYTDGALPEGYNYLLQFDGEKVTIEKDGAPVDVYSSGIYTEKSAYAVPGYQNYTADASLRSVTVTMLAVQTPMEYHISGRAESFGYYSDVYTIYSHMLWVNQNWRYATIASTAAGVCLLAAIVLRRYTREGKVRAAACLNRLWIEGKALILLALGLDFFRYLTEAAEGYGITEMLTYYDYGNYSVASELAANAVQVVFANPLRCAELFWIVYFLILDIHYNHAKPQNGLIFKFVRAFDARSLQLDFSRRQVRRTALLTVCTVLSLVLSAVACVLARGRTMPAAALLFALAAALALGIHLWYSHVMRAQAQDLAALDTQIARISQGEYTPDAPALTGGDLARTEENLLQIQSGIMTAVDREVKSERMKVELVANVSHDLKTPLTSIISYVQFLKEEDGLPDHVKDYVRILDEKSARLNAMVQDVFSISKATSGQLPVNREVLDFGRLLHQTLADMDEVIARSGITIKADAAEHQFFIAADGQRMYRVCQNLVQNALQYSLDGSRLYITLSAAQGRAVAVFKNTSRDELDQATDFSARFVRGDESRTDGGSGLGLSIAKSFTEACGGTFSVEIDGDMFVVKLAFPLEETAE